MKSLVEVRSCDLPLCQLADLMAGIAAYTRTHPHLAGAWLSREAGQESLLQDDPPVSFTSSDRQRLPVVHHLNGLCKAKRLGVSLATKGYLMTHDPSKPLNFWHYVPQHLADRAPTRLAK